MSPRVAWGEHQAAVRSRVEAMVRDGVIERLWAKDPTLWSDDPAHHAVAKNRLGWLDVAPRMRAEVATLQAFARECAADGFTHALLLGMGGSSLAPEVFRRTFGVAPGMIDVQVLDSTSPAAVRAALASHDPAHTLCIVSSKSGGTLEVVSLEARCWEWIHAARGAGAGRAFIAITDPGTSLADLARTRGYRHTFTNPPDIGGRYSALSYFGLVPAALLGVDIAALLDHAEVAMRLARAREPKPDDVTLTLGAALGELGRVGRDKVTLVLGREIESFGSWVEQLVAESTGKEGRGLVPVPGEPLGTPDLYGADRVFVAMSVESLPEHTQRALDWLERDGHPVLRWRLAGLPCLGAEFLRWEIATAIASMILKVDAFDEPNVTEAKQAAQAVLERYRAERRLPEPPAVAARGAVQVQAPEAVAARMRPNVLDDGDPASWLRALLALGQPGDYVALLVYLHRTPARQERLQRLRVAARAATRLATTLGFGPRFLHSTGQLHKGGPNTGLFVQMVADEGPDEPIPGRDYGFAAVIAAQSLGDYEVLVRRGRRVLRLNLGAEPDAALDRLVEAMESTRV